MVELQITSEINPPHFTGEVNMFMCSTPLKDFVIFEHIPQIRHMYPDFANREFWLL